MLPDTVAQVVDCTKADLVKGQVGAETKSSLILPRHALEEVPVSNCTEVLCWLEVAEKGSLRESSPVAGRPPVAARRMLNERHSVCCLPPVPRTSADEVWPHSPPSEGLYPVSD